MSLNKNAEVFIDSHHSHEPVDWLIGCDRVRVGSSIFLTDRYAAIPAWWVLLPDVGGISYRPSYRGTRKLPVMEDLVAQNAIT